MEKKKEYLGITMLFLTSLIWGFAFVAQSMSMKHMGPFSFNTIRFGLGGLVLIPIHSLSKKYKAETLSEDESKQRLIYSIKSGLVCGVFLFLGGSLQQFGLVYSTVAKAGFISALYIIIIPLMGVFMGKKEGIRLWIAVLLSLYGMYLLCINESLLLEFGDLLYLLSAFAFSLHIVFIDKYSKKADAILLSCIHNFMAALLSLCLAMLFESPIDIQEISKAWMPLTFVGILSCGMAFTMQIIGQKYVKASVASMILSLESVISAIAAWIILSESLSIKEILGCILVFLAIILAQLKPKEKKELEFSYKIN